MRILMVCLGNICRSPMAEGLLREKLNSLGVPDIEIDSAGTGGWHEGEAPDRRAQQTSLEAGIDISLQKARKISPDDLNHFDWILALDHSIYEDLLLLKKKYSCSAEIDLYLRRAGYPEPWNVKDPWSGSLGDFKEVFDLLEAASQRLAQQIHTGTSLQKD